MFAKYLYITRIFSFLLYFITPMFIFINAQTKLEYFIAFSILLIGFALNYFIKNRENRKFYNNCSKTKIEPSAFKSNNIFDLSTQNGTKRNDCLGI